MGGQEERRTNDKKTEVKRAGEQNSGGPNLIEKLFQIVTRKQRT